jgi:hypothetical protein
MPLQVLGEGNKDTGGAATLAGAGACTVAGAGVGVDKAIGSGAGVGAVGGSNPGTAVPSAYSNLLSS